MMLIEGFVRLDQALYVTDSSFLEALAQIGEVSYRLLGAQLGPGGAYESPQSFCDISTVLAQSFGGFMQKSHRLRHSFLSPPSL